MTSDVLGEVARGGLGRRGADDLDGSVPVGRWSCGVVGVAGGAVAVEFRVDVSPPARVVRAFEDEDGRAFGEDETVAVGVEGA